MLTSVFNTKMPQTRDVARLLDSLSQKASLGSVQTGKVPAVDMEVVLRGRWMLEATIQGLVSTEKLVQRPLTEADRSLSE